MNNNIPFYTKPFLEGRGKGFQILCLIFICTCSTIVSTALISIIYNVCDSWSETATIWITQAISSIGVFLVSALWFSYLKRRNCLQYFLSQRLPKQKVFFLYAAILSCSMLAVSALCMFITQLIPLPEHIATQFQALTERSNEILAKMLSSASKYSLLINLLVCAVLPAICEEFFFRGTLQTLAHELFRNKHAAIWTTAFIFSVVHLDFSGFLSRWILGVYLGYLLVWSRSLWVPILAHFLNNAYCVFIAFLIPESLQSDSTFGEFTYIFYPLFLSLFIIGLLVSIITLGIASRKSSLEIS